MVRFIIRPFLGHYRIVEVVSDTSKYGALSIQWDGLHSTIETAVARIETELGVHLVCVAPSHFETKPKPRIRPKLRLA